MALARRVPRGEHRQRLTACGRDPGVAQERQEGEQGAAAGGRRLPREVLNPHLEAVPEGAELLRKAAADACALLARKLVEGPRGRERHQVGQERKHRSAASGKPVAPDERVQEQGRLGAEGVSAPQQEESRPLGCDAPRREGQAEPFRCFLDPSLPWRRPDPRSGLLWAEGGGLLADDAVEAAEDGPADGLRDSRAECCAGQRAQRLAQIQVGSLLGLCPWLRPEDRLGRPKNGLLKILRPPLGDELKDRCSNFQSYEKRI
mmetsp:Transcript_33395/g.79174  ORF Transcript_33395/g.79174 Transcript_33395/m.79174 type:complete len:261 (+) Transcript_33395:1648-2430(+)